MARPECLKYCIAETDFIERFIFILGSFYFMDNKKKRTEMVAYQQEGQVNDRFLNIEIQIIKVGLKYLTEIPFADAEKNQKILAAFHRCFREID